LTSSTPNHSATSPALARAVERPTTRTGLRDPCFPAISFNLKLVEIKTDVVNAMPRTITATSIPSMLKVLQDEWDACMLNSFRGSWHSRQIQNWLVLHMNKKEMNTPLKGQERTFLGFPAFVSDESSSHEIENENTCLEQISNAKIRLISNSYLSLWAKLSVNNDGQVNTISLHWFKIWILILYYVILP
ncbi:hypothetical protein WUBG_14484, partial [Wuchereria bancrofti]